MRVSSFHGGTILCAMQNFGGLQPYAFCGYGSRDPSIGCCEVVFGIMGKRADAFAKSSQKRQPYRAGTNSEKVPGGWKQRQRYHVNHGLRALGAPSVRVSKPYVFIQSYMCDILYCVCAVCIAYSVCTCIYIYMLYNYSVCHQLVLKLFKTQYYKYVYICCCIGLVGVCWRGASIRYM